MTELAYMIREDWGQDGTAMASQSAVIRKWLGTAPYLFAVQDLKKFNVEDRGADVEAAGFIAPNRTDRVVYEISELASLRREGNVIENAVVLLHPFEERELETIRLAFEARSVEKLFVLVWSRYDLVRTWLDGLRALNLHTQEAEPASDPVLLAAATIMKHEEYNGLASGRGKDAVVQLVRAFSVAGYPIEPEPWLHAYFAMGGSFRHAESIKKLVNELKAGTRHRVKPHFRDNIFEILSKQVAEESSTPAD